jgi:hypothetical protein
MVDATVTSLRYRRCRDCYNRWMRTQEIERQLGIHGRQPGKPRERKPKPGPRPAQVRVQRRDAMLEAWGIVLGGRRKARA